MIAIMGIGGGKSLIFMLSAWCGRGIRGTTVVIMLLITLRGDMMWRYRELELECIEWSAKVIVDGVDIVLVTPKAVFMAPF